MRSVRRQILQLSLVRIAIIGVFVLIWSIASIDRFAIPSPGLSAAEFFNVLGSADLWMSLLDTVRAWLIGLALCFVVGMPLGVLLGKSDFAYQSAVFLLDFVRSVPAVALLPLIVLIVGANTTTSVLLVFAACVWPVILQTIYGVRDTDKVAEETMDVYGVRGLLRLKVLVIPTASPYLVTSMRIATVTALLVTVSSELLVGIPGIGNHVYLAQYGGQIPKMYAYVLCVALLGLGLNYLLGGVERRILAWHPSVRDRQL